MEEHAGSSTEMGTATNTLHYDRWHITTKLLAHMFKCSAMQGREVGQRGRGRGWRGGCWRCGWARCSAAWAAGHADGHAAGRGICQGLRLRLVRECS